MRVLEQGNDTGMHPTVDVHPEEVCKQNLARQHLAKGVFVEFECGLLVTQLRWVEASSRLFYVALRVPWEQVKVLRCTQPDHDGTVWLRSI